MGTFNGFRAGVGMTLLALLAACSEVQFHERLPAAKIESGLVEGIAIDEPDLTKDPITPQPEVVQPPVETPIPNVEEEQPPVDSSLFVEEFKYAETGSQLDIIVVVDNSASMRQEQEKLGQKISSLLGQLRGIDWRIGITTTDVSNYNDHSLKGEFVDIKGARGNYITPNTSKVDKVFLDNVVRRESANCFRDCPSSNEQPIKAALLALKHRKTKNRGFFRDNANIAVLIISDEDEMSTGPSKATQPSELVEEVKDIWPNKVVRGYGIIIEPGDRSCYKKQSLDRAYGTFVDRLARLTGGLTTSLCAKDYGKGLSHIGASARTATTQFKLAHLPQEGTLNVVDKDMNPLKHKLDGQVVTLLEAPENQSKIYVMYDPE